MSKEGYTRKIKCELYNDSMQEEWRDVVGYEGFYQVSNLGRVRTVPHYSRNNVNGGKRFVKGQILSQYKMPNGYLQVQFSKNEKREKHYVHRLVANTFLKNKNNLPEVNHIDGNKDNNSISNLEWVSHKINQIHMIKNRMSKKAKPVLYMPTKKEYNSMTEAEKITGISRKTIKKSCELGGDWRWLA